MDDPPGREALDIFRTLDARGWDPPEPMVRTLEALAALPPRNKVVMLINIEPRPLFRILKMQGYDYRCTPAPEGHFEVSIWRARDISSAPGRRA